jgi:uncharacterized protein
MKNIPRVKVTDEAKKVIHELRAKHGALMFHQSGGCNVIIEIAGR